MSWLPVAVVFGGFVAVFLISLARGDH